MNFFSNTSTRGKILALVAVMAFLLVSVGYIGYRFTTKGAEDTRFMYYDRLLPVDWLNNTATNATGIKANVFALMTAADETVRKNLNDEISEFVRRNDRNLEQIGRLELETADRENLSRILAALEVWRREWGHTRTLIGENKRDEALDYFLKNGLAAISAFQGEIQKLLDRYHSLGEKAYRETADDAAAAISLILGISAGAVIFVVLLGLFIASRIAGPLNRLRAGVEKFAGGDLTVHFEARTKDEIGRMGASLEEMAETLRDSMKSIAAAADRLGNNAEDFSAIAEESNAGVEESRAGVDDVSSQMDSLAAASEEINASVEEVASGAQSSAQKSTEMATEVEHARMAGEEGMKAVNQVVSSVAGVASESEQAAKEVKSLGDRAREIQSFVSQIGGIADQTNLLALNAAIEAARAGEAGRGFAVVAEEVRKLAEESNEAAKKIAELAGVITKDLDRVVATSEKSAKNSHTSAGLAEGTRETIGKMMEALSLISSATQDLAAVSQEQAASSEEIAGAVQNIVSRVSAAAASSDIVRDQMGEVAASAERVAQGSEDLAKLSVELRKLVERFRFDHGTESRGLVPAAHKPVRGKK